MAGLVEIEVECATKIVSRVWYGSERRTSKANERRLESFTVAFYQIGLLPVVSNRSAVLLAHLCVHLIVLAREIRHSERCMSCVRTRVHCASLRSFSLVRSGEMALQEHNDEIKVTIWQCRPTPI